MDDEQRKVMLAEQNLRIAIREELPEAVAEGFKKVITPDTAAMFANVFIDTMKAQASVKVDTWAGAAVKGLASKLWQHFWIIALGIAFAYSVGGFGAVAALVKWGISEALK